MINRNPDAEDNGAKPVFYSPTFADLAEIVQLLDDAIIVVNERQQIVFLNDQAAQTFEYDLTEMLGQSLERLFTARQREWIAQYAAEIQRLPKGQRRKTPSDSITGLRAMAANSQPRFQWSP